MRRKKRTDTKYTPKMCNIVIEVAKEGGTHAAMMLKLEISRGSFYSYIREYPEFARAVEQADLLFQADQEQTMNEGSKGNIKGYNFQANAFILQNKFKEEYPRDSKEPTTSITINNLNLTPEEVDYKIAQLSEKLRSMGCDLRFLPSKKTIIIEESQDDCPD